MAKKIAKKAKKKSVSKSKKPAQKSAGPVTPISDRVLIRPHREAEKKIGALIIPASGEKQAPDTGIVLAVGEGRYVDGKLVEIRVRVGDRVMFSKYSYDEITVGGEELYIMREENILAVINNK